MATVTITALVGFLPFRASKRVVCLEVTTWGYMDYRDWKLAASRQIYLEDYELRPLTVDSVQSSGSIPLDLAPTALIILSIPTHYT